MSGLCAQIFMMSTTYPLQSSIKLAFPRRYEMGRSRIGGQPPGESDGSNIFILCGRALAHIALGKREVDTTSAAHVLLRLPPTQDQHVGVL
nr:hypothetical protein [Tanacetum cinerariifolium]